MTVKDELKSIAQELRLQITLLATLVLIAWGLEVLDEFVFNDGLNRLGIYPREWWGLKGILLAPFLHGDFFHLLANTVPFITFGWLIMLWSISEFWTVSAIAMLVSGSGTWLFGRAAFHIGASGVVFGYFGYLLARGYFERKPISILVSLFVGIAYGSLLFGVLPQHTNVSWEGHLFGLLGGILAARLSVGDRTKK